MNPGEVVYSSPTTALVVFPDDHEFKYGQKFGILWNRGRVGILPSIYTIGSIAGFGKEYGETDSEIEQSIARAKELHHEVYWANQNATILDSSFPGKKHYRYVELGSIIRFEGKRFRVEHTANRNVRLVEVA